MVQDSIKCPKCGEAIPLSEALSHDIEERARRKYESQLSKKETEFQTRLQGQHKELESKAKKQAKEEMSSEIADLTAQVEENKSKLAKAQQNELSLLKRKRELEDREKGLELETERKLSEQRQKIEEAVRVRFEEQHRLKDSEKDKLLSDTQRQVDELKRSIEQGSQQMQGEVLELELEEMLKREFPFDSIEPVSKGIRGADIIQTVKTQSGRVCGKILWEAKRVKNWSDSWIQKLKDNQAEAKADISVLVSQALPTGFHHFRKINDIWVTDIPSTSSLALALRTVLIQVAHARELESGKDGKKDLIYSYVTGSEFRNRVSAIVEGFQAMKEDLEAEKRAMQKIWGKREKQIEKILSNTAGMHGDLEGLAGTALPQIKVLELPTASQLLEH